MRYHWPLDNILGLSLSMYQLLAEGIPILHIDKSMTQPVRADFMPGGCNSPQQRFDPRNVVPENKESRSRSIFRQKLKQDFGTAAKAALEPTPFPYGNLDPLVPFLQINRESVQFPWKGQVAPLPYFHSR